MHFFNMRNLKPEEIGQLREFGQVEGWKWESAIVRVYNRNGNVLGFYGARVQVGKMLFIERLVVHPDYRKIGIGTILHQDLLKLAQSAKIKTLVMVVHECNQHLNWLKNWGWKAIGVQKNVFGNNRDGYVFQRGVIL